MTARPFARRDARGNLEPYMREIGGDPLLSAADERQLAGAIAEGDQQARDRMVACNLRLVVKIARDYAGHGLEMDDLIGEGNLGLIRAAAEFDPQFGVRFSTYAAHWIRQAIRHALTNTTATIRLPSHMVVLLGKWRRADRRLARDLGVSPSFEQIADDLGLSKLQRQLVEQAFRTRKLRNDGGDGNDAWTPEEAADGREAPEASSILDDDRRDLRRRLARLEARERRVLELRFGLAGEPPLTLKEVGARLGVTREWVRKIEARALEALQGDFAGRPAPAPAPRRGRRPAAVLQLLSA